MTSKMRWGDTLDDDDFLPPTTVTGPDAKGIKTMVEYKKNDQGDLVKTTTKMRVSRVERKQYNVVKERRQWKRFGEAVRESADDNYTVQAVEEIPFERIQKQKQTQAEKKHAADLKQALAGTDKQAIVGSLKDMLYKKRMERQLAAARGQLQVEKPPDEDGPDGAPGGSLPAPGQGKPGGAVSQPFEALYKFQLSRAPLQSRCFVDSVTVHIKGSPIKTDVQSAQRPARWVPPSLRNRQAGGDTGDSMRRREENSVRVTNLSEDTREDDLRDLFSPFGNISRIYIAYDRETGENRGFAFVNFVFREDASRAISNLDGYGYDNLILRVEWAQPRAER